MKNAVSGTPPPIPVPEIRDALARVVQAGPFLRSGQLQRLLRFLVEETVAGRGDHLKEYVIGVEVFARPGSYDPRLDSLVRVEARRLRAALASYYAGEGRDEAILIDLQKGSYVPSFRRRETKDEGQRPTDTVAPGPLRPARRWAPRIVPALLVLGLAAVLVVLAASWLMRTRQAQALTERDSIVLVGFGNSTGESIFDETLKQGLTVVLEQSPFLNIVSDRRVAQTLRLMGRTPTDRANQDVAREVCLRTASQATVSGTIARLGSHYVIGLTASSCATGDAFAHVQAQAGSKESVLKALNAAASEMRAKMGESLASIQRFDASIEEATTPSLEALRAYSLGQRAAREKGSPADIPFYKRAIELDPDFAIAHAALGVSYVNLAQPSVAREYLEKAHRLRDRVSEREKYRISAYYYHAFSGELPKAREVYELWKQSYPRDFAPSMNLGVTYTWLGAYDKSLVETSEAARLEPGNVLSYSNLAALYIKLGRAAEARTTLQQALARKLTSKFVRSNLCYLAFLENDRALVEQQLAEVRDKPGDEDLLLSQQSDTEAYYGRLARAREMSRRAVESARRAGAREAAAGWLANAALREAEFGNQARALADIAGSLGLAPGRDVIALASLASARAGDLRQAERLLADLKTAYPLNTVIDLYWAPTIEASIEVARGHGPRAVELLQPVLPYELGSPPPMGLATLYPVYVRGDACLLARDGAAAAREFQKILDHPGLVLNFPLHALAWLKLARARAMTGDVLGARQAYDQFFLVWKDADPDIPVLRRARAEYHRLR